MSRFVRQSSYRHTYGTAAKKEKVYDNIKISASAWDTNLVSVSEKYIAVNYQSSGGGSFLVTPLDQTGKHPDMYPLCRAHTAPVLDTAWSPFDDSLIASAGEDGRVAITRIDERILLDAWSGDSIEVQDLEPMHKFSGHGRKAGHVAWHPTANGILASASTEVKVWDVGAQAAVYTSETHSDMVQSISWDYAGTVYATTCKDKKLRLFDPRTGAAAVVVADSHSGIKGSRVEWMGSHDRIVTTGFSRTSERQVYLWDSRDLMKGPLKSLSIDQSSGTLMPFWNEGNSVLFLAGKGDGNIRYYEYADDDLFHLAEYSSPSPQRGMCFLPPRALNVSENEIARAFKCVGNMVEPISFVVPRKSDAFQGDLFPPALSGTAALSAAEWLSGKNAQPILVNLESRLESSAIAAAPKPSVQASAPAPVAATPVPAPAPAPTPVATAPSPQPQATPVSSRPASVYLANIEKAEGAAAAPAPTPVAAHASTPSPPVNGNGAASSHASDEEVASLKREIKNLKDQVAERDNSIRHLEIRLEKVKSAMSA